MKGFVKLIAVVVTAAAFAVSCSKDKDSGAVSFDKPAVFIDAPSGMATVGFTLRNIKTLSVTSQAPRGLGRPMRSIQKPRARCFTVASLPLGHGPLATRGVQAVRIG